MIHRLGKLPVKHDRRTLRLARYLTGPLPVAPRIVDWTPPGVTDWGEMENDRYGCCAFAAPGHQVQAWTGSQIGGSEVTISDADVLAAYSAVTGFNPSDPSTDNGAAMLDVCKYWRNAGIGGHKILAFVAVNPTNLDHVKLAAYLFGGLYAGFSLPQSASDQLDRGEAWDVASGPDAQPGSWGGHAVYIPTVGVLDPGAASIDCVTWGRRQAITPEFFLTYADELYAILSQDWATTIGKCPNGFDLGALQADLNAL